MDIKGMYQKEAEGIAEAMYELPYFDLGAVEQAAAYAIAVDVVNERIAATADALIEIDKYRCKGR